MLRSMDGMLFLVCRLFTDRQRDHISDLYQEIVCNLWESWPHFQHRSDAKTWAYKVALNTVSDMERSRTRRPNLVQLDRQLCNTLADSSGDEQVDRLYELIDRLEEEDKQIIFLYLDRLKASEIASLTGYTEAAVKQRIYRIKQKLKTMNHEYE